MDKSQYAFWSGLFQIHCKAYDVLDHIIPPTTDPSSTNTQTNPPTQTASWERLDAIDRLKGIFQDNKNSCAVYLQHQFTNTHLDNFPDASKYYQELKILADQLGNIGPAIEEERLVLQLVTGLNDSYASLRSIITHREKLPSFYEARSMLILEESQTQKLAIQAASTATTALVSSTGQSSQQQPNQSSNRSVNNRGRGAYRGNRGRNSSGNRGRGRANLGSFNTGFHSGYTPGFNSSASPSGPLSYGHWAWNNTNWALPPTFPTTSWTRPQSRSNQPGVLGPRPNANSATSANYASSVLSQPTDIEVAMHTMSLNPPDDNWYLDTGAISHMPNNQGKFMFYYPTYCSKCIIIEDGNGLPIQGYGHNLIPSYSTRPLHLNSILYSPHLIKNLIYVRCLSIDNNISIEFDPFGFTVKDFLTIMRCNSTGDLYPFHPSLMQAISSHSAFSVSSSDLWHQRLGQ
ncbi:uncharacterized protein [Rutidosis leptorrhynchoides]|uniref:uncharacterized protein n=1 Tax=Rutidosis leptorrhynchoides TaxID=125765 RepID=UPI003A9908E6